MKTPNSKQHRILVDLKIAMNNGYCGIAKENRLIFKMLSQTEATKATGMLVSANSASVFSNYKQPKDQAAAIDQANHFFHEAFHHDPLLKNKILKFLNVERLYSLKKNKFDLYSIAPVFQNAIWRNVFDKTLGAEDRDIILKNDFLYTDLTSLHLKTNSYFKKSIQLNTEGYDFAFFLEPTMVSVSPNTIKIVRYHDTIPITEPDFSGSIHSQITKNMLKVCAEDSYFVCNSEPTRRALIDIQPELAAKALMVPSSISSNYKKVNNEETLKQIIVARFSRQIVKPESLQGIRKQILGAENLNYIFNLATLDPKKNHITLIKAWEKLNYQHPGKLKLIIAANKGWFSAEAEAMMRSHIELGNIIHLDNLSIADVPYLFSHAQAFIFPSYAEGFGLPPLEAMQCECPTIVSDIPAHRWVMGEASLYSDPYDPDALTEAMAKLLYHPGAAELRQHLIHKGLEQVKRYSESALSSQWSQLFDQIRS